MNKATGERNCLVCGKRVGKNLVLCELCPRAYHTDCHNPVMPKVSRVFYYRTVWILCIYRRYISLRLKFPTMHWDACFFVVSTPIECSLRKREFYTTTNSLMINNYWSSIIDNHRFSRNLNLHKHARGPIIQLPLIGSEYNVNSSRDYIRLRVMCFQMPRGKWYCSNCHSKQPKKRNSSRRSHTKGGGTRESESSDHPPAR